MASSQVRLHRRRCLTEEVHHVDPPGEREGVVGDEVESTAVTSGSTTADLRTMIRPARVQPGLPAVGLHSQWAPDTFCVERPLAAVVLTASTQLAPPGR